MSDPSQHGRPRWARALIVVGFVGVLAAVVVPYFIKLKTTSSQNACINNLRQIDGAKDQWAIENKKQTGDAVVTNEVIVYVKGSTMPICPEGGSYVFNKVGEPPTCTIGSSDSTNASRHRLP